MYVAKFLFVYNIETELNQFRYTIADTQKVVC